MRVLLCVLLPAVLALPPLVVDMAQQRHLQTDIDMDRDIEHIFTSFKQMHSEYTDITKCVCL